MGTIDKKAALAAFEKLLDKQLERAENLKKQQGFTDYTKLDNIIVGVCGGDGIGPVISEQAVRVLEYLIKGKNVIIKNINGLTIENRVAVMKPIPDDVMSELKSCHVILKGPTTTPQLGDPWPNIESANVAMRKELDLFANVRPVSIPEQGIDWTFFRENTEGAYTLGSQGIEVGDLAMDFTVTTTKGTERIARQAYEFARRNGKTHVTIVTKANVIKATDGKFLRICQEIGKEYPEITTEGWLADIMTAKLIDEKRRRDFQVIVLPNLYGDIITDEAAEIQGGVGTAGGANIGVKYAMFEAIHGSAPRMVKEGRAKYADPCSMLRATEMLLSHIGFQSESDALRRALNICMFEEKKLVITARDTGATSEEFCSYVISKL